MKELRIEIVENGFVVTNNNYNPAAVPGTYAEKSIHVFQSAQGLAEYIHEWGEENEKLHVKPASPAVSMSGDTN